MRMDAFIQSAVDHAIHRELWALLIVDADLAARFAQREIVRLNVEAPEKLGLLDELALFVHKANTISVSHRSDARTS